MKRFKYGQNSQYATSTRVGSIVPVALTEVVPGDTISGKIESHLISDVAVGFYSNRAYYDLYTFYVPYRLLWEGFPDFIIKGTGTLPLVSNLFHGCFEKNFTTTPVSSANTKLVPWSRRAYNMIYNQYFKRDNKAAQVPDGNSMLSSSYRPSTFLVSEPSVAATANTAASLGVDDMREAFAKDQFDKAREYFGDKYTDYLAAVGVQAPWSILEEPEVIAKTSGNAAFSAVNSTDSSATVDLAQLAGYYKGKTVNNIPRKFIPEHGLVMTVGVLRIDIFSLENTHTISANTLPEHYWSPEYDAIKERAYPDSIWIDTATAGTGTSSLPNFEHLRKGISMSAFGKNAGAIQGYSWNQNYVTVDAYKDVNPVSWDSAFQGTIGYTPDSTSLIAHAAINTVNKLVKNSPVGTRIGAPLR